MGQNDLTEFFAELTEFGAELSEVSFLKHQFEIVFRPFPISDRSFGQASGNGNMFGDMYIYIYMCVCVCAGVCVCVCVCVFVFFERKQRAVS